MAGAFPTLSDGNPVKAGYTHSLQIRCAITRYRSGKEQRHAVSGLLNSFKLSYERIKWADLTAVRDFFITQKGAFDQTWTIDILDPSTQLVRTYAGMAFASDEFAYVEQTIGRYSLTLEAVQTAAESVTVATATNFPTINAGVRVQLPFNTSIGFKTDRNDLDSGKRVSYAAWASPLRSWRLEYPVITDDEVTDIVDMYIGQGGPVNGFTFTDPNTSVAHSSCRFGYEPLQITRVSPNLNRLSLGIEEYLA